MKYEQSTREYKKNPGGGEIFRIRQDRPWGPPNFLYNGYPIFCPGLKKK